MGTAVRGIWSAAVVAACIAPSAAANVWPRLTHMWEQGAASGNDVGITAALVMSVLGMAAVPFAMKKATNWGEWLPCLLFGLVLAGFNYTLAVEVAGKWRDQVTAPAALTAVKAAALKSRIDRATAAMAQLPQLPHATAAMATAANQAVQLAKQAVDQECGKVGRNCRKRVGELDAKTKARAVVLANRAVSEKRENYEAAINKAQVELDGLGVIPDQVDPAAARIAKAVGVFVDLGPKPELKVIEWWPTYVALLIEAIAMWLPRIILMATTGTPAPAPSKPRHAWPWYRPRPVQIASAPVAASSAAPQIAVPAQTPATAARLKKSNKTRPAVVSDSTTVRQWKESRTVARSGSEIKPKQSYDEHYVPWCRDHKLEPVSFTKFGTVMKASPDDGGCGVAYQERNKRGFYLDLAHVGGLKVAVDNAGSSRRLGRMAKVAQLGTA